ncbi:hypothetical protein AF331_11830 [Rossellomorea marisflavi]|uniref:Uncharacterized protein n=1 Tax=Rossellomorea marisflavi TaxID=189381 RepID=A0A0M0G4E1_9BACI|nr:hypothetical protein [Rossellomorea marisflavi]KON84710.1 hypothetical protein AF331_11830 [Rossellomorea marisflavi]MCM2588234.1 hypothetical protein [Rossellomorea marisflavi]
MELRLPENIKKRFWLVFPFAFVPVLVYMIFFNWEPQLLGTREWEDVGRLLFITGESALTGALLTIGLLWVSGKVSK